MDEELKQHLEAMEIRLTSRIEDNQVEIAKVSDDLRDEIRQSRAETARLIESLQTSVDAIRDDIAVLGGANDHTRRKAENTRDEARDLANSLADIHRILIKHGSRLDALERITPPKDI